MSRIFHTPGSARPHPGAPAGMTPGLTDRLIGYLVQQGMDLPDDQYFEVLFGGKSNLTYRFDAPGGQYVLRRPPLGRAISTAHDMGREYRVMTALQHTEVPVPRTVHRCENIEVIGAPFYIMEYVEGATFRTRDQLESVGAKRARRISESMIDTLVALHEVNIAEVGLADFGRPNGYLARQVRRWMAQLDATRTRDLVGLVELYNLLESHVPASGDGGLVHGDFRLDNLLIDGFDRVVATIDWELSTLGDPLADLGMLLVYQRVAEMGLDYVGADASRATGYLSEKEIVDRYTLGRARENVSLDFVIALSFFKLAAIREGIHYRYVNGQTVGDGFVTVGDTVPYLVNEGLRAAQALR